MREIPATEVEEVRGILSEWGYQGETFESLTNNITSNPILLNHIFQYHLMVQNILHNKASYYGYVVLIYHKHDKAFLLSNNG